MEGAGSGSEARGSKRVGALTASASLAVGTQPGTPVSGAPASGAARTGRPAAYPPRAALLIRRVARRLPPRTRRVLLMIYRRGQARDGPVRRRWHPALPFGGGAAPPS